MDQGLLAGLAEGLRSGLQTYREQEDRNYKRNIELKKMKEEQEDRDQRLALLTGQREVELARSGYKRDENGKLVVDPESLAYQKMKQDEEKQDLFMRAMMTKEQQAEYDRLLREKRLQADIAKQGLIEKQGGGYELSPEAKQEKAILQQQKLASQGLKLDEAGNVVVDFESPIIKEKLAKTGLIGAQTETEKARPGLIAAQTKKAGRIKGPGAVKPPTEAQYKTAEFAKRLDQAEDIFVQLEQSGYQRGTVKQGLLSMLPGALQPGDLRKQDQAERNFVNAVLRRESGAAISASEFASAEKQYFPRPGDTPEVLAQKKANRDQVRLSLRTASRGAYGEIPTVSAPNAITQKGPKVGTIKGGYRFKGGDPSKQSSWEKVK